MMRIGHFRAQLILMALIAIGSGAYAQDVLIDSSGNLSRSAGKSLPDFNLLTVQYDPTYGGPPSFQGGPAGSVYERPIPNNRMVFSDNGSERQFYSYEGMFFRLEYLNWDFKTPNSVMGESTLLTKDITEPFDVTSLLDPSLSTSGLGKVSTLDPLTLHNTNGVRGVLGIPLTFGSFEGSAFGFHIAEESFNAGTINGSTEHPFRLNSFTVNGATTDVFKPYSSDYGVNYTSKLYGAETNLIFDGISGDALTFKPIAGFRFMNLTETMQESGVFESSTVAAFRSDIESDTLNNLYVPQIGMRIQFESKWFTLAFDPKFGLGLNDYSNKVSSNNILSGDGYFESKDSANHLMQMVDLGLTGRVPVSEYFNITLGYNFMWLGRISRASHNVAYDVNATDPTDLSTYSNNIHVDTRLTDMFFQGASIGGEFIYR